MFTSKRKIISNNVALHFNDLENKNKLKLKVVEGNNKDHSRNK
jgi:hypothetical protein